MSEKEYFSTGEIAELTGVTVRTLQYYDNIELLPARKRNKSGHRLYDKSDLAKLQQIIFYKSLGLKISEIQEVVQETTTKAELIARFEKQQGILYQRLNHLMSSMAYLETSLEVLKADHELSMTHLIQLINALNQETIFEYETIEFDAEDLETFAEYYDDPSEIMEVYWQWKALVMEAMSLILEGVSPASEQGLAFAQKYVAMTEEITRGDEKLLDVYLTSSENREAWPEEDQRLLNFTEDFIEEALESYKKEENR